MARKKRRSKLTWKVLRRRISGLSAFGFGLQWEAPKSEREIVRGLLKGLEEHRALYNPYHLEIEQEVTHSLMGIRAKLTEAVKKLPDDSKAMPHLQALRVACREYLDDSRMYFARGFLVHLGELRARFGQHLGVLAGLYQVDLEGEIVSILPPELREDDGALKRRARE